MKLKDLDIPSQCEKCKWVFPSSGAVLRDIGKKYRMAPLMQQILMVEPDGTIVGVTDTRFAEVGSSTLTCPKCGAEHLYGFDKPEVKV